MKNLNAQKVTAEEIAAYLKKHKYVSPEELAAHFGVSVSTSGAYARRLGYKVKKIWVMG